mgnify:CR=1 FL=1
MKKAFSLIELSIVFMIISILITFTFKGLAFLQNAKLIAAQNLSINSPLKTINGLKIWYNATSSDSLDLKNLDDGDLVKYWNDVAINKTNVEKINLSQTNQNNQPTFVRNAINSLPSLYFINNDTLKKDNVKFQDIASSKEASVFYVQTKDGSYYSQIFSWDSNSDTKRFSNHSPLGTNNSFYFDFGACCTADARLSIAAPSYVVNNKPFIGSMIKGESYGAIRINGNPIITSEVMTSSMDEQEVSLFRVGNQLKGYIGELIIFNRRLSDEEIDKIESYLSDKWGVELQN